MQLTTPLAGATHRWQVTAVDARGQMKRSRTRSLRIDALAPLLSVRYSRKQRVVTVSVRARDRNAGGGATSGIGGIVVSWGDRTKGARARSALRARHRYRGAGDYPLEITAPDAVGNAARVRPHGADRLVRWRRPATSSPPQAACSRSASGPG